MTDIATGCETDVYCDPDTGQWGWYCLSPSCDADGEGYDDESAAEFQADLHEPVRPIRVVTVYLPGDGP